MGKLYFPGGGRLGVYIIENEERERDDVLSSHLFSKRLVSLTTVYSLKISVTHNINVAHLYRPAGMLSCKR